MPKVGYWIGAMALAALVAAPDMASARGPNSFGGHAAARGGGVHGGAAFRGAGAPRVGGGAFRGAGVPRVGGGVVGHRGVPFHHRGAFVGGYSGYYDPGYVTYPDDAAYGPVYPDYGAVYPNYGTVYPDYGAVYPDYGPAYGPGYYGTDVDYGAAVASEMIPAVISIMRRAMWATGHRHHVRARRHR